MDFHTRFHRLAARVPALTDRALIAMTRFSYVEDAIADGLVPEHVLQRYAKEYENGVESSIFVGEGAIPVPYLVDGALRRESIDDRVHAAITRLGVFRHPFRGDPDGRMGDEERLRKSDFARAIQTTPALASEVAASGGQWSLRYLNTLFDGTAEFPGTAEFAAGERQKILKTLADRCGGVNGPGGRDADWDVPVFARHFASAELADALLGVAEHTPALQSALARNPHGDVLRRAQAVLRMATDPAVVNEAEAELVRVLGGVPYPESGKVYRHGYDHLTADVALDLVDASARAANAARFGSYDIPDWARSTVRKGDLAEFHRHLQFAQEARLRDIAQHARIDEGQFWQPVVDRLLELAKEQNNLATLPSALAANRKLTEQTARKLLATARASDPMVGHLTEVYLASNPALPVEIAEEILDGALARIEALSKVPGVLDKDESQRVASLIGGNWDTVSRLLREQPLDPETVETALRRLDALESEGISPYLSRAHLAENDRLSPDRQVSYTLDALRTARAAQESGAAFRGQPDLLLSKVAAAESIRPGAYAPLMREFPEYHGENLVLALSARADAAMIKAREQSDREALADCRLWVALADDAVASLRYEAKNLPEGEDSPKAAQLARVAQRMTENLASLRADLDDTARSIAPADAIAGLDRVRALLADGAARLSPAQATGVLKEIRSYLEHADPAVVEAASGLLNHPGLVTLRAVAEQTTTSDALAARRPRAGI